MESKYLSRQALPFHVFTVENSDEKKTSAPSIKSLEVFKNVTYIMAKYADPKGVPSKPDDFLEQFNTFSIYEILPQLIKL